MFPRDSRTRQTDGYGRFRAPRAIDDLPNVAAYVKRIQARPAYQKAMQIAGPNAVPP